MAVEKRKVQIANCRFETGTGVIESEREGEFTRRGAMKMRADWGWRADWQKGHESTKEGRHEKEEDGMAGRRF